MLDQVYSTNGLYESLFKTCFGYALGMHALPNAFLGKAWAGGASKQMLT